MSEDLRNEQEAINSIYGEHTFEGSASQGPNQYLLAVPHQDTIFRLFFPPCYPEKPPQILGTFTVGETTQKGYGTYAISQAREILNQVFIPGTVCVFDLLQRLETEAGNNSGLRHNSSHEEETGPNHDDDTPPPSGVSRAFESCTTCTLPSWTVSSTVSLKRSVFIARACPASCPSQAKAAVAHLLANDKRVAKATHNITAYRIRSSTALADKADPNEIIYQDCDDDGETAAGGRLLYLLQVMDVWDVCVVVSRWYGGVQLGPDRFRLINQAAREAVVEGGWSKGGGRLLAENGNQELKSKD